MTKRIALIDDEKGVLQALTLLIGTFGVGVQTWDDPKAAQAILCSPEGASFDAVISDLRMPGIDGIELLTMLLAYSPQMPCAIISGHASSADLDRAKNAGIRHVLRKPFGIEELRGLLKELSIVE